MGASLNLTEHEAEVQRIATRGTKAGWVENWQIPHPPPCDTVIQMPRDTVSQHPVSVMGPYFHLVLKSPCALVSFAYCFDAAWSQIKTEVQKYKTEMTKYLIIIISNTHIPV